MLSELSLVIKNLFCPSRYKKRKQKDEGKNERKEEPWGNGQDSNTKKMQEEADDADTTVRVAAQSQEIHKRTEAVPDKMHEMHSGLGLSSVGCVFSGSLRWWGSRGRFFLPLLLLLCLPCCGAAETHKSDSAGITGPTRAPVAQFPPFALGGPWQRSWLDGELHFDAHVPLACRNQRGCSRPQVTQVVSQWMFYNAVADLSSFGSACVKFCDKRMCFFSLLFSLALLGDVLSLVVWRWLRVGWTDTASNPAGFQCNVPSESPAQVRRLPRKRAIAPMAYHWLCNLLETGISAGPARLAGHRRVVGLRGAVGLGNRWQQGPLRACRQRHLKVFRRQLSSVLRKLGVEPLVRASEAVVSSSAVEPPGGWQDLSFLTHVSDLLCGGKSHRARRKKKQWQHDDSTSAWRRESSQAPVRVVSQDNLAKLMMRRLKDCLNHNASDRDVVAVLKELVNGWDCSDPPGRAVAYTDWQKQSGRHSWTGDGDARKQNHAWQNHWEKKKPVDVAGVGGLESPTTAGLAHTGATTSHAGTTQGEQSGCGT